MNTHDHTCSHNIDENIPDCLDETGEPDKKSPELSHDKQSEPGKVNIKHLVISGGGVTGFSFYGILRETNKLGMWDIENIQTIYGTSIGSVLAVILALRYEWDVLDAYLIKRPWKDIFKFDLYSMIDVIEKKGIFNMKIIEEIFQPLFLAMNIPINITMKEFYERTRIEIHIYSTELNKMESVDFSYKTHPEWSVVHAVYCSCVIPLVFEPYIVEPLSSVEQHSKESEVTQCYVDGGFLMNYPVDKCIAETGAKLEEIMGINKLQNTSNIPIDKKSSIFDYVLICLNRVFDIVLNNFQGLETTKIPQEYTIVDGAITLQSIIDTAYSMEERCKLIQAGVDMVKPVVDITNT